MYIKLKVPGDDVILFCTLAGTGLRAAINSVASTTTFIRERCKLSVIYFVYNKTSDTLLPDSLGTRCPTKTFKINYAYKVTHFIEIIYQARTMD